jgi:hypothetical protein
MKKLLMKIWNATPWGRMAKWRGAMMKLVEIYNVELYRLRNDVDELKKLARVALDERRNCTPLVPMKDRPFNNPDFSELNKPKA